jgi:hypothetical protein
MGVGSGELGRERVEKGLTSGGTLLIVPPMNHLAAEMARRNGLITFKQACERYDTTKDKLRDLISTGLLTCQTSNLDRRAKLLSVAELDGLLGNQQETSSSNNAHLERKVA